MFPRLGGGTKLGAYTVGFPDTDFFVFTGEEGIFNYTLIPYYG